MLGRDIGIFTEQGGTILFLLSKKVLWSWIPSSIGPKHLIARTAETERTSLPAPDQYAPPRRPPPEIFRSGAWYNIRPGAREFKTNQENAARRINRKTNSFSPIKPIPIPGARRSARNPSASLISAPVIPMATVLCISSMPILCIAATWFQPPSSLCGTMDRREHEQLDHRARQSGGTNTTAKRSLYWPFGYRLEVTGIADDLKKFGDYLGAVLKYVDGEIRAGKTKEQILKATMIPGAEEWKRRWH